MKTIIRVPLEAYSYIELEVENLSATEAIDLYKEYVAAYKNSGSGTGIDEKQYRDFIDKYLMGEMDGLGEMYAEMSPEQQKVVQTIKKSLARIKVRQNKNQ